MSFRPSSSRALAKAMSSRAKAGASQRALLNKISRSSRTSSTTSRSIAVGGWAKPSFGGELKFVDTSFSSDPAAGSVAFTAGTLLNSLDVGAGGSQRVGRKVTIKSLLIRYQNKLAPTSVGGSPIRILVVYDKQANGAAPAITDILLTDSANSPNNIGNSDRFVTLSDQITMPVSTGGEFQVSDVIFKKLNLETMFNANTDGGIDDITSGSIYMFVAQFGGITVAAPDFSASCRVRYTDK